MKIINSMSEKKIEGKKVFYPRTVSSCLANHWLSSFRQDEIQTKIG
jgi:hypothetical protein